MKTSRVDKSNERIVVDRIKNNAKLNIDAAIPTKFRTEDRVRISKHKIALAKVYTPVWTNEIFTVYREQSIVIITFLLRGHTGELLRESFYGHKIRKSK